jgi:hypothetical protein
MDFIGIAPLEAHLFLNHVPLIGLVFGLVFLVAGLKRSSDAALRASLRIFVAMSVIVVLVAGSGLVSANILADATWLDADALSRHRLAGIFTLAVFVTLGRVLGCHVVVLTEHIHVASVETDGSSRARACRFWRVFVDGVCGREIAAQ